MMYWPYWGRFVRASHFEDADLDTRKRPPYELVDRICQHLCPRCQSPDSFPPADTTETRQAKTALARLSRTCKTMRVIAQPFVFHYYATGNFPEIFTADWGGYQYDGDDWPERVGRLPRFLRSIIKRPDLAKCVQALQLVRSSAVEGCVPWRKNGAGPSAVRQASLDLGVVAYNPFHPDFQHWTRDRPDPRPTKNKPSYEDVHHTLEHLAILLCPNVSVLFLVGDFSPSFYGRLLRHSNRTVPALRTISLLSESRKYHYAHTWTLLALAPNVETIYAADLQDCELPYRSWTPAFNGTFSSVRKVVAHNFGPIALATFVQSCPQLREFQYAHTADFPLGPPLTYTDIVEALKPVRKSLRRLAMLIQTEDDFLDEIENALSHDPITPFEYLETLEELLIPQDAIYGRSDNEQRIPGGFASLLPRSIRNLNITYCDGGDILTADLEALARDAPRAFPNLRSVTIGLREGVSYPPFDDEDGMVTMVPEELERAFAQVGVTLGLSEESFLENEKRNIPGLVVDGVAT
ncbi:hypothetical protein NEMBOFW57_003705 [Staphylotrichum longicolle]|uniref:Uncharacterized protein n=1 Tax=Staphylotrichum longicolle TaxID=669026 RepID=A0AAD4F695_9PEZI|nr:hypothetical protein NEMBOFW57_003705 [Staphylotrichum longicolle]